MLLVDGHVHLHPSFRRPSLWQALDRNFQRARRIAGRDCAAILLLTEVPGEHAFDRLAAGAEPLPPSWRVAPTADDAAVTITAPGRPPLFAIAGCQIVTRDGLEIAALGTRRRIADGLSASDALARIADLGVPAVVPWGFGKWVRGRRALARLLERAPRRALFLADSRRRPAWTPAPAALAAAATAGIPTLAGSDPLDLAGHEAEVGAYGFILPGQPDPERPARGLLDALRQLDGDPRRFGQRCGFAQFAADQVRIRLGRTPVPQGRPRPVPVQPVPGTAPSSAD
jgi:hypothetical protein